MPREIDPALEPTQAFTSAPTQAVGADTVSDSAVADDTVASGETVGPPGQLVLRDYDLGAVIGRGGMGEVLLGRDRSIGRDVAIKQLRGEVPSAPAIARFLREARIQARLEHPAIVPVHALGTDDRGRPYFTMKRLSGRTLKELLASKAPPPRARLLRMFGEICRAVEFAHARGVVHRDLKPSNIMVGDFGAVYVLDWGLARIVGEVDAASSIGEGVESLNKGSDGMTLAGTMLGTPGYMAPEQIEDASTVGPAADVYALGSILFEILAGETVHVRGPGTLTSTLVGVDGGPHHRRPDAEIPPELDALCIDALVTRPGSRPSVVELADRLDGYLDGDRDVVQRRELARTYVAAANTAVMSGDRARRAEAIAAAGRALVLDPTSTEAGAIVSKLVFGPVREPPAELHDELAASELRVQRRQGRAAIGSFAVVLVYLALTASNGVLDAPFVIGLAAYTVVLAAAVWRITQRRASAGAMLVVAAGNAMLAALISRTLGSMIIVPAVTCIMALSLTAYPQLIDRRWTVIGLLVASWVMPVVLELAGVLTPTWQIAGAGVELTSSTMQLGGYHTAAILIGANVVTIVVFGLFASALATSRRDAMRTAEIQAWHLRQLLPTDQRPSASTIE